MRLLLQQPQGFIGLARAKIAIDTMVTPSVDPDATLHLVQEWAAKAEARFPTDASKKLKMDCEEPRREPPTFFDERRHEADGR